MVFPACVDQPDMAALARVYGFINGCVCVIIQPRRLPLLVLMLHSAVGLFGLRHKDSGPESYSEFVVVSLVCVRVS